jgi:hypothetical protein
MRLIPLSVVAMLLLSACEPARIRDQSYADGTPKSREGFVILRGDTLTHGLRTTWYPNGVRASVESYAYGYLQGYSLHWHPNGRLSAVERYAYGDPDGQAKYWDEEGRLIGCSDETARDCLMASFLDPDPERLAVRPDVDGPGPESLSPSPSSSSP